MQNIEYKRFVWELSNLLYEKKEKLIFLCIGTSKIIGDSVGPLVGSILQKKINTKNKILVVGDCVNNFGYKNIDKKIDFIKRISENNFVIVIDSALDKLETIGKIFVQRRGLEYGACLKKRNEIIGNICIKAVVGKDFKNRIKNYEALKKAPNEMVYEMVDVISNGIIQVINP